MKIFVGQIYVQAGVIFPFSFLFQRWLGDALSKRVEASEQFIQSFGTEFELGLRISAKKEIDQPEIKGPTLFKQDKTVEFTIFLPYQETDYHELATASLLLEQILRSVLIISQQIGLNSSGLLGDISHLQMEFLSTPGLLDPP